MKVTEYGGTEVRLILIGMATDVAVLRQVAAQWKAPGLFANPDANLIGTWCVDYLTRHGAAPGKALTGLFAAWATGQSDAEAPHRLEELLDSLSRELEERGEPAKSSYLTELAGKHFAAVATRRHAEELLGLLDAGRLVDAEEKVKTFRAPEVAARCGLAVFQTPEAIAEALEESEDALIHFPGPLGKFFGNNFRRDSLIAFAGPEKRGKCVSEDMEVLLADGRVRTIGQIVRDKDKTPVVSLNEKTQRFESLEVSDFWSNGKKECWRVKTRSGRSVTTTANHEYLTPDGWRLLEDIRVGDYIAVPKKLDFFGDRSLPENEIKLLAYLMAEGCCGYPGGMSFTNTDPEMVADFEATCAALKIKQRRKGIANFLLGTKTFRMKYHQALWNQSSKTKQIPPIVFACPKEQISLFLRIFFSCDGHISKGSDFIELTLANRKLTKQIGHLLTRFGIVYHFGFNSATYKGKKFRAWRITIRSREYVDLFLKEINFISYKRRDVPEAITPARSFLDKFPCRTAKEFYAEVKNELTGGMVEVRRGGRTHLQKGGFYRKFGEKQASSVSYQIKKGAPVMRKSFVSAAGTKTYEKYMGSHILWDQVVSIEDVGERRTYDLTVPGHHNFVTNDCVVHNSFILLDVAWRAMLNRCRVAYIEAGDMSRTQAYRRFMARAARRPVYPSTFHYPVSLEMDGKDSVVIREERRVDEKLTYHEVKEAYERILLRDVKSRENRFMFHSVPAGTLTVPALEAVLTGWERDGYVVDVVIVDYADLLAPPPRERETREKINAVWIALRALSIKRHCLVVTATQTNRASYRAEVLTLEHSSEDKRKAAHVTGMVGLNMNSTEKREGRMRMNWMALREDAYTEEYCVHVAGCRAVANPAILSCLPDRPDDKPAAVDRNGVHPRR